MTEISAKSQENSTVSSPRRASAATATATTTSDSVSAAAASNKPIRLRIAIVGSEGTGKSCIIKRYCEKRFVPRYLPTIGIDYGATKIYMDKRAVSVHIFDTSGSPVFSEVRNEFYRDMHGIILVCDVGQRGSFDSLCDWANEIQLELAREGRDFDKTVVVVCCNKCDQQKTRQVDELEARLWAEMRGFNFFETSAYSGEGINDMFQIFFSQIVKVHHENGLPQTPSSARKVHVSKCGGGNSVSAKSAATTPATAAVASGLQPSGEQALVMSRLRGGKDPWQQLGLTVGCTKDDVNKVYRKLAMLLHPDKTAVQGADEAFKALGMARRSILRTLGAF